MALISLNKSPTVKCHTPYMTTFHYRTWTSWNCIFRGYNLNQCLSIHSGHVYSDIEPDEWIKWYLDNFYYNKVNGIWHFTWKTFPSTYIKLENQCSIYLPCRFNDFGHTPGYFRCADSDPPLASYWDCWSFAFVFTCSIECLKVTQQRLTDIRNTSS